MYLRFEHSYFELLSKDSECKAAFPVTCAILITWNSQELSSWLLYIPKGAENEWDVPGNSSFLNYSSHVYIANN